MAPQMLATMLVAVSWSTVSGQLRGLSAQKNETNATDQNTLRSAWGSCQKYGCPSTYIQSQACQCNSRCQDYHNCCSDITSCSVGAPPVAAPSAGEFDSPLDLDSDPIWTWSDGGLFEGDVRFVKQQIRFEDGKMKISATKNPGYSTQACSHAEVGTVDHKPLVSGEFRSRRNIFRYGRYEVRMKAPDVQPGNPDVDGNFVATMFIFRDAKFRHWREIDIEVTGDSPNSVTTNVLRADNTEFWRPQIASVRETNVQGNARAEFHTYGFEWLPDRITWYIDGVPVRSHYGGNPPIPDKSAKVMMNLWIFGPKANFGGRQIDNNRYPMTSEYDWFRFYKWDG
ncbi:licB, partial [Symbiodinium sp. CCMP2456]